MESRFREQVAIVTGASSGIGRAAALRFAREGARLAICANRNVDGLEQTRRAVEDAGAECLALKVDVRERPAIDTFVQSTLERYGTVDILVNNAGTAQFVPFAHIDDNEYERVMDTNVRSVFYFCQAVLPTMKTNNRGKIVNVTSVMGEVAAQGQSIYNASKGAAKVLTQAIAVDVSGYNINVNAVAPGMVVTNLTERMLANEAMQKWFTSRIPQRRIGQPDEIAGAVAFLCSPDAAYVHGATLVVDGGMLCTRDSE